MKTLDDTPDAINRYIQCFDCKHYDKKAVFLCAAFPKASRIIAKLELGIPNDILSGEFDHTKKHPDQENDILFEEAKNEKTI